MHELMFTKQDSLGTRKWSDFASEAGVANVAHFLHCLASPTTSSRVARDTLLGNEIGVRGTPTILVNDVMIGGYPGLPALQRYVTAAAHSRSNLSGY
jgi:protein-disulfide isomerase